MSLPGKIDLLGRVFGSLTVMEEAGRDKWGSCRWLCECTCTNPRYASTNQLTCGMAISCGDCAKKRMDKYHGRVGPRDYPNEYSVWIHMKMRCMNPNNNSYYQYGGRGITICDRWLTDFSAFLEDLGPRPGPGYSLERIDNDGPYAPWNCRWATKKEQANNRRTSTFVTYGGRTLTIAQWADELPLKPEAIAGRLARGWSVQDALNVPMYGRRVLTPSVVDK